MNIEHLDFVVLCGGNARLIVDLDTGEPAWGDILKAP